MKNKQTNIDFSNVRKMHSIGYSWTFNCWGATVAALTGRNYYWLRAYEMEKWLNENTTPLKESPVKGDVFILRDSSGVLVHTGILIGKNRVWHKCGAQRARVCSLREAFWAYRPHAAEKMSIARYKKLDT